MRSLLILLLLVSAGCASVKEKRVQEYEAIEIGMVKSQVIDLAGPPYWSDRKDGQDRWIYYMEPEDKSTERIVYFEDNKVVAKGLRKKPFLSADEMEEVKKDRPKKVIYKQKVSDKELRRIIKKDIEKAEKKKKKKENYEPI